MRFFEIENWKVGAGRVFVKTRMAKLAFYSNVLKEVYVDVYGDIYG